MTAIAQARQRAATLSRKLSDVTSPAAAAKDGALVLGGAFLAGSVDKYIGPEGIGGAKPSSLAGVALAAAGLAMRSPNMITAASGMLAHTAYEMGGQAVDSFVTATPPVAG